MKHPSEIEMHVLIMDTKKQIIEHVKSSNGMVKSSASCPQKTRQRGLLLPSNGAGNEDETSRFHLRERYLSRHHCAYFPDTHFNVIVLDFLLYSPYIFSLLLPR